MLAQADRALKAAHLCVCPVESEQETPLLSNDYKTEKESGVTDLFIFVFFLSLLSADTLPPDMFYPCPVSLALACVLQGTEQKCSWSEAEYIRI